MIYEIRVTLDTADPDAVIGEQYATEADNLEAQCKACEQRKKEALRKGDHETAARQERLIELHTQQRNDLLRLVAWLKHYYDGVVR